MKIVYGKSSILTKSKFLSLSLVLCGVFAHQCLQAQVIQEKRFEFPINEGDGDFDIIPSNTHGLFLLRKNDIFRGTESCQLIKLDTAFNLVWQGTLPVPARHIMVGKRAVAGNLYLLYRYQDFSSNDFLLYQIHEEDGMYTQFRIKNFIPFATLDFQASNDCVLIGGYFNRVPVVVHFSLTTAKSKVLPGLFNEVGELNQIQINDDGTFDVLIKARNHKRQQTIVIRSYSPDAELLESYPVDTDDKKNLIFGRLVKSPTSDVQFVAGVYGQRSGEYSSGIFIARIENNGAQEMRYYPYAELKNFFKFMKAKREQRIKERIARKKIKGKKVRFNYRFLVHQIVPYKGQFVLLGEAFYPKYRTIENSPSFFGTSRAMNVQDGRVFDGYHYTHAVVIGFDPSGKISWDNSFEINDVKTFTLEQFVKMNPGENEIALLYVYDNKIRSKIIQGDNVIEGKATNDLMRSTGDAVAKSNANVSKLEYWYGNYMFAYGVEEATGRFLGRRRSRVFYINKVTVAH